MPGRLSVASRPEMAAVVRDIMDTDPATVRPETPVEEVVSTLRRHELPGLPVVDGEGRVVGMITEADLVLPDDDGDLHIPHYINLFGGTIFLEPLSRFEQRLRKAFASNAADMMTSDPDTVSPDTTVQEAARIIHESGHNRLPVVEDGRLVGVVTRVDVLGALAGGATWLGVATAGEARDLRDQGVEAPVLVMGAVTREELRMAIDANADVVAWTDDVADAAPRVHVKLDTGMGRLGTKDRDYALRLAVRPNVTGLMTHFATADERGDDLFPAQVEAFRDFVEAVGRDGLVAHAANSAAALRDPAAHFDLVRCGIAIYGMDPFHEDPAAHGLEPALSLHSYVAAVRRFARGESAGYGRSWRAERPTRVATIPIGYGDGWRRGLSNDCDVLIRSQGEERIVAEEVARRLGTINYEVTTGLLPRVRREHVR